MKLISIIISVTLLLTIGSLVISCVSARISSKDGIQLWEENCQRCHNTPSSTAFPSSKWEIIMSHMRQRAMLTETEYKKIQTYMQTNE